MKINDEQLMQMIWINQLRCLSRGVLHNYVGGGVGLCNDDDFWFSHASGESRIGRHRVAKSIGKQQLLNRIRKLSKSGDIKFPGELIFYIDGDKAKSAFNFARYFWLKNGVPEGMENGRCRTAVVDVDELSEKCFEALKSEYAQNTSQPCTYPDCRCPIELPHKDSPCAIGRNKDSGNDS